MTKLLEQAFEHASRLTEAEQDLLAARLLAEIEAEDEFDEALAMSSDQLSGLVAEALVEDRAGLTQELNPDEM